MSELVISYLSSVFTALHYVGLAAVIACGYILIMQYITDKASNMQESMYVEKKVIAIFITGLILLVFVPADLKAEQISYYQKKYAEEQEKVLQEMKKTNSCLSELSDAYNALEPMQE